MSLDFGTLVTLALAAVGGIIWLIRLEGRVNTADRVSADQTKEIEMIRAKADAEALAHNETTIALVRVQEQLKHLTGLVERLLTEPKRRTPAQ